MGQKYGKKTNLPNKGRFLLSIIICYLEYFLDKIQYKITVFQLLT